VYFAQEEGQPSSSAYLVLGQRSLSDRGLTSPTSTHIAYPMVVNQRDVRDGNSPS
jgi:hypothetical protein